jgi:hypothetical protein
MYGGSRGTFGEEPDGWLSFEEVVRDYRRNMARMYAEKMRERASADEVTQTPAAPGDREDASAGAMLVAETARHEQWDRSRGAPSSGALSAPRGVAVEPAGVAKGIDGNLNKEADAGQGRAAVAPGVAKG